MCDFSKGFVLCRCGAGEIQFRQEEFYKLVNGKRVAVESKKNKNIPLMYIWQLFTYVGKSKQVEMGRYQLPGDDLGNGLNAEWIALNLNDAPCFDFDYTPQEGDNLFIRQNVAMGPYISFIHTNGVWVLDNYDPFLIETLLTISGKIMPKEEKEE
jgi:hypothetical protein